MKRNYISIVSLLIICTAIFIYSTTDDNTEQSPLPLHTYVNPIDLQSITIAQGGKSLELVPRDSVWFMQDRELLVEVDAGSMLTLFDFINTGTIIQRVTQKTDTYPRFNLTDETALVLTLQTARERSTLFVGKTKDHASQFVRLPDDPSVYLVSKTLETGPEPWHWYYRGILRYESANLESILYDCGEQTVHLQRDSTGETLTIQDIPEGKIPADIGELAGFFRNLNIGEYVPREQAPQTSPLATHTLNFTDGSSATLRFLDRDEEQDRPPFLDIVFNETEPADEKLRQARNISARYVFSLSWIDPSKYLKNFEDFFTDAPAAAAAEDNESAHADCESCQKTSE